MRGLYAITDEEMTPTTMVFDFVKQALLGGARIIQLRDKKLSDIELYPDALVLNKICKIYGAKFILNDRVDLAVEVDADGVHIGKDDVDIEEVKKKFNGIIGVSCYGDIERAKEMEKKGADYVAFGAFFNSSTKPDAPVVDLEIINRAKQELNIPVCVIGGITIDKAKDLVDRGADMVAVISDLWGSKKITQRSREYAKLFFD